MTFKDRDRSGNRDVYITANAEIVSVSANIFQNDNGID